MKNAKQYTQEFKSSTIQLALNSDKSVIQIAKDLEINEKTLYGWIRAYKQQNKNHSTKETQTQQSTNISKNNNKETLEQENRRLRAELKTVTQEREILKKAAAYFAKGTL